MDCRTGVRFLLEQLCNTRSRRPAKSEKKKKKSSGSKKMMRVTLEARYRKVIAHQMKQMIPNAQ